MGRDENTTRLPFFSWLEPCLRPDKACADLPHHLWKRDLPLSRCSKPASESTCGRSCRPSEPAPSRAGWPFCFSARLKSTITRRPPGLRTRATHDPFCFSVKTGERERDLLQPSSFLGVHVSKPLMGKKTTPRLVERLALHRHQASISAR